MKRAYQREVNPETAWRWEAIRFNWLMQNGRQKEAKIARTYARAYSGILEVDGIRKPPLL